MNKRETTKYEKLQKQWIKTGEDMVKAQAESVEYGREIDKVENPTKTQLMKDKALLTKGFKLEEKADEYDEYKKKMEESTLRQ